MPTFEDYRDWRLVAAKRKRIERELIAKGLLPRSNKFEKVLGRKMRR